ncbi:hypothetical protein EIN_409120 [Entamoeba invadens IP1]|uniref:Uncharacterized protein n=2 Tax=Entamoeba invadens TaxID=33085 RepID=A0A0A1U286_ENTIV|nr:hypothetical protein EIN_409120 [Entamoeba invadens IP1]ELP85623.1 hypothetical protein EIN_409120 [Entamoeba invadens IP1]BAN40998.1 hypothetical protein [Entamoeba invadens]BAN42402.1 hypothetical protein [Entamoeba invadens]|eukprot:XP_004184969.1 hypothetical protein EIN_409120 [Entamoeba invadens IP1]
MAYSFPKFSLFIGLVLMGVIIANSQFGIGNKMQDQAVFREHLKAKVHKEMCNGKYPAPVGTLVAKFPMITSTHMLIAAVSALALCFLFNLIPQNGFFSWVMIHLFTLAFFLVAITAGYLFAKSQSDMCVKAKEMVSVNSTCPFAGVMENKFVQQGINYIPETIRAKAMTFKDILVEHVTKLGINAPIFVIVIAFYLINKNTRSVTRFEVLGLISLIVSLISGYGYYQETHDVVFSIVFPIATIVLVLICVNLALKLGFFFVVPEYFFSAASIAFRLFYVLAAFNIPFAMLIAVGFFVFLFVNIAVWSDGFFLSVVFLLNFGLSKLYTFPADSLVVLLFTLAVFTCDCCCKKSCKAEKKPKTD